MDDSDIPTALRQIADALEDERQKVRMLLDLLKEARGKVPDWAGLNDDAHGWYVRSGHALEELGER